MRSRGAAPARTWWRSFPNGPSGARARRARARRPKSRGRHSRRTPSAPSASSRAASPGEAPAPLHASTSATATRPTATSRTPPGAACSRGVRGAPASAICPTATPVARPSCARRSPPTSRARGVACEPDDVLVVYGTQQAIDLTSRVLIDPGARAIVEEPGYPGIRHALEIAGAEVLALPVDADGLPTEMLAGERARLVCVTPSHQFPTGGVLSLARRLELLAW